MRTSIVVVVAAASFSRWRRSPARNPTHRRHDRLPRSASNGPAGEEPTATEETVEVVVQPTPPPPAALSAAPGEESGRVDELDPGDSQGRKLARALLYLPRAIVTTLLAPIRVGISAETKYHILGKAHGFFYNDAGTFGVYPSLAFESGYGFRIGFNLVATPTIRDRLQAFVGGDFGINTVRAAGAYDALDRGDGMITLSVGAEYEKRPDDRFYGYGNNNSIEDTPMPISLGVNDVAIDVRYRQRLARTAGSADLNWISYLHTRAAVAIANTHAWPQRAGAPIDEVVDPMTLAGFARGTATATRSSICSGTAAVASGGTRPASSAPVRSHRSAGGRVIDGGHPRLLALWRQTSSTSSESATDLACCRRVSHVEAISVRADTIPFPEVPHDRRHDASCADTRIERFRDSARRGRLARVPMGPLAQYLRELVRRRAVACTTRAATSASTDLRMGYGVALEFPHR